MCPQSKDFRAIPYVVNIKFKNIKNLKMVNNKWFFQSPKLG